MPTLCGAKVKTQNPVHARQAPGEISNVSNLASLMAYIP